MDAKEYLQEVTAIGYKLKTIDSEINELINLSQRAGAIDYSKENIMTSSSGEPSFLRTLEKLDEKANDYSSRIETYTEMRNQAFQRIHMLTDGFDTEVIYEKFFLCKTLKQIAAEKYYSFDSVCYHYKKGLREFNRRRLWEAEV